MLQTQFLGAGASGFYGPLSGYSPADITALQKALIKAGKSGITANGVMNGATAAAVYEIIRDKGGAVGAAFASIAGSSSAASGIMSVFNTLKDMDSTLSQVPGVSLSIPSLLRDASKVSLISSVAGPIVCALTQGGLCAKVTSIASTINNTINTFFSKLSEAAPTLLKVVGILVPGSVVTGATTPTPTPGTTPLPTPISPKTNILTAVMPKMIFAVQGRSPGATTTPGATPGVIPAIPGLIWARSKKFPGMIRIAIPRTAGGGFGGIGLMSDGIFGDCIFGDCGSGLGAGAAAPLVEQPKVPVPAPGAPLPPGRETDDKEIDKETGQTPFFKKPLFWVAVVGGAAVVGGGSYWFIRRRKRTA